MGYGINIWEIMNDKILTAIIAGVAGLFTGIIGSLIAPWVHWGIEKRRNLTAYRREKIMNWKKFIEHNYNDTTFQNSALYSELRPHLSKRTIQSIEGNMITLRQGRGGQVIKGLILDDISEFNSVRHDIGI